MQTFLPEWNYSLSAEALDNKRLGKQRVEAKQIYLALTVPEYGWKHHPAVKMWKGYEYGLLTYGLHMCIEWVGRGFKDTLEKYFEKEIQDHKEYDLQSFPDWYSSDKYRMIMSNHRAALYWKDPELYVHYNRDFDDLCKAQGRVILVGEKFPYYWPKGREF